METRTRESGPRVGRMLGAVLLCAVTGAAVVGLAGMLFGAGFAVSIAGWHAALLGGWLGLRAGLVCGFAAGLVYSVIGGPLGVAMAGFFGGAANPMLPGAGGLSPVTLADAYDPAMRLGLPFLVCWLFAWFLFRAAADASAIPLFNMVARFRDASGLDRLPLPARFAAALALGTLAVHLLGATGLESMYP